MSKAKTAKALAATAVAVGAGLVASPASATAGPANHHGFVPRSTRSVTPDTTGGCKSGNGVVVCGHITGSFQSVKSMSAWACVNTTSGMWIHVQVKSPLGHSQHSPHNTPTYFRSRGNCTSHYKFPKADFNSPLEPGGWHFIAWRHNPNGTYTPMLSKTLTVDA